MKTICEYELYGMMHTTWHTLHKGFSAILHNGLNCISDGWDKLPQRSVWHYAAQTVRRVMPANGDYSKSGWSEKMVGPGL